jgi:hypothetical protein
LDTIDTAHWKAFLTSPVDFIGSLNQVASVLEEEGSSGAVLIEMGAHPVFAGASSSLAQNGVLILAHVVSMMRGENGIAFLHSQRLQGLPTAASMPCLYNGTHLITATTFPNFRSVAA